MGRVTPGHALLVVLALSSASACSDDRREVSGRLVMSGGAAPGASIEVPGTVTFQRDGSTTTARAGRDGTFHAKLRTGTYSVTGRSPNYGGNKGVCKLSRPLVVTGDTTNVTVTCLMR